jgi:two-component system LytT family response regulator
MKILVLEDDIHDFHSLRRMMEEMDENYEIVGPIYSVAQGREYLASHKDVDIIIADIHLSGGLCFEALRYAGENTAIIFISAKGEYALRAFQYNSLSYLMKPVDNEELAQALEKAKRLIGAQPDNAMEDTAVALKSAYRKRFLVRTATGERVVPMSMVLYLVSENKTSYLKLLDGTSYPLMFSLEALAEQLNPADFMRVNRKYILSKEHVAGLVEAENGKAIVNLSVPEQPEIVVSRDRKMLVRRWLMT